VRLQLLQLVGIRQEQEIWRSSLVRRPQLLLVPLPVRFQIQRVAVDHPSLLVQEPLLESPLEVHLCSLHCFWVAVASSAATGGRISRVSYLQDLTWDLNILKFLLLLARHTHPHPSINNLPSTSYQLRFQSNYLQTTTMDVIPASRVPYINKLTISTALLRKNIHHLHHRILHIPMLRQTHIPQSLVALLILLYRDTARMLRRHRRILVSAGPDRVLESQYRRIRRIIQQVKLACINSVVIAKASGSFTGVLRLDIS